MGSQYRYRETYGKPADIERCRLELEHLHQLVAEYKILIAANREFLKTAWKLRGGRERSEIDISPAGAPPIPALPKACRDKAIKKVTFAGKVNDPYIKRFLEQLESQIAE
jgi:hypothetical protein